MKNDDQDNVIQFPGRPGPKEKGILGSKHRLDLENKKVMVSGSLASILLIMTLMNVSVFAPEPMKVVGTPNDRFVASISVLDRNTAWEQQLAKKLRVKSQRGIASVGRRPTSIDDLKFGELQGKYSVQLKESKLTSLKFVQGEDGLDEPKYLNDRIAFLNRNKKLLPVDFRKAKKMADVQGADGRKETYDLLDHKTVTLAKAEFLLDTHGRLLSFQVVKTPVK